MAVHRDWVSRTPKWLLLAGFWALQAAVLWCVQAFLYASQSRVEGSDAAPPGAGPDWAPSFFGEWPTWEAYTELLTMTDFIVWMGGGLCVLTAAQAVFVLPVRRPGVAGTRGKGLRTSLFAAGFVIGALVLAVVMSVYSLLEEYELPGPDAVDSIPAPRWMVVGVIVGAGWLVATPLLIAFTRPGPRETVLTRLSRRLLLGTMIEVALLIPLDVMVRRKTSCYCWAGSYWALTLCGAVGVFALGPAVFLPLLARRRRAWYAGRCPVCGYDMRSHMDAPRCPECGTGWRA